MLYVPPGEWWVSAAWGNQVSPERGPVEAGGTVELQLEPGGGLDIDTFNSAGVPVAADVRVFDASGQEVIRGDSPRGFDLPHVTTIVPLLPGAYTIRAAGPGGQEVVRNVTVNHDLVRLALTVGE